MRSETIFFCGLFLRVIGTSINEHLSNIPKMSSRFHATDFEIHTQFIKHTADYGMTCELRTKGQFSENGCREFSVTWPTSKLSDGLGQPALIQG